MVKLPFALPTMHITPPVDIAARERARREARGAEATIQGDWLTCELATHRNFLKHLASRQLHDQACAEDAVQETLLAAWLQRARFEHRCSVRTWLVSILRHKIIDVLRSRRRLLGLQPAPGATLDSNVDGSFQDEAQAAVVNAMFDAAGRWADLSQAWFDGAADADGTDGDTQNNEPSALLQRRQMLQLLELCLTQLSAQSSRVFLMREYLGFDACEVAQHCAIQAGHVRVLLHRARLQLRGCLDFKLQSAPEFRGQR
jgi:RNA polymerase sigma-70 factor, ECF subfamily